MRLLIILPLLALPSAVTAQGVLSRSDSALIGRILLAEDRRDSTDRALVDGGRHSDPRVRTLVLRARGRIRDSLFASRDSLPAAPPPVTWPEPAWRLRYRALATPRNNCAVFRAALADSSWPVRLRAADLVPQTCAGDSIVIGRLTGWLDGLPTAPQHRRPGGVSWHAGAHAGVALARLAPTLARPRLAQLTGHRRWQVRVYGARAAAALSDTAALRALVHDPDDNVKEAAIEALAKLTGHQDDELFIRALRASGAQAVRAAAIALKGSPHRDVRKAANSAFDRWVKQENASSRDVRQALLEAAGRPLSDDRPPPRKVALPADAVALALGSDIRLWVMMDSASGNGAFVVRLRGDVAPMMAARILALVRERYYDGLGWHRVEHDFVIQGGSPGANEYVGLSQYLRDELGNLPHTRGTVGMSTRGHDTGDAQWFVNLKDNLRLGRDYTVFGEVVDGIEAVDDIMEGDVIAMIRVL